jgi:proline iminopeptidase
MTFAPFLEGLPMSLYPPLEAYETGMLEVSALHTIYWEQSGNPAGEPIVFVHGGPGGGTEPSHRRFFDPSAYRIILFDQRGCGKSRPHAELRENTTWDLVADMERLRARLGIARWHVFGGSWGSTLAMACAIRHPEPVASLTLRGIFMVRQKELTWFYQHGCSEIFPDAWEKFIAPIPPEERGDFITAYQKRLTSQDAAVRASAARAWSVWEATTSKLVPDAKLQAHHDEARYAEAFARIECHYFVNRGFLPSETFFFDNIAILRRIPGTIIHGRYDVVCPIETAWELHKAWPEAEFRVVPEAGHSAFEPAITRELVTAADRFRGLMARAAR